MNKKYFCEVEEIDHIYHDKTGTYDIYKLHKITKNNPTTIVPLSKFTNHIKKKEWGKYSIKNVLDNPDKYPEEMKEIKNVDLRYPILIHKDNVIDGNHRLAKAFLLRKKKIKAKYITDNQMKEAKDTK